MTDQKNEQGSVEQRARAFNPNEHLMQIKSSQGSKDYLPVQWRLVWFRELCPQGTIETEMVHLDLDRMTEDKKYVWNAEKRRSEETLVKAPGFVIFKATVTDGKGGKNTGYKSEKAASFPDYLEKCETGSIGRALAGLGYGTQFTGDEFDEQHRIVDAPVDRGIDESTHTDHGNGRTPIVAVRSNAVNSNGQATDSAATDQQLASIRKLCEHLGKKEPELGSIQTFAQAKEAIAQLSQEYRNSRRAS
jgi:hypothetical protein